MNSANAFSQSELTDQSLAACESTRARLGDLGDLRLSRSSILSAIADNEWTIGMMQRFGGDPGPYAVHNEEMQAALVLRGSH